MAQKNGQADFGYDLLEPPHGGCHQVIYCFSRKNTLPVGGALVALLFTTLPR